MELIFYDSKGKPVSYTEDCEHIYLFSGEPVAYFNNESIYSFSGKHFGRFKNGWIRDNYGLCVFFTKNARGGPIKPIKMIKPMKSLKKLRPLKAIKEIRPLRPIDSLSWSELSGEQFFKQKGGN